MNSVQFPWWYAKLLSWYMPEWLIQVLEQPAYLVWGAGCCLVLTLLIILTLSYLLCLKSKTATHLQRAHDMLTKEHAQLQATHAQQQMVIAQLTALVTQRTTQQHKTKSPAE